MSKIRSLKEGKRYVAVVSLDIHGAFDHVYHEEAIKALRNRGTPQYIMEIMADYFKGRKVSVETKSKIMDRGLLIIPADSKEELDNRVKLAVQVLMEKFRELGLTLNRAKTEILLLENEVNGACQSA